jgi:CheY-like chemotaxis protein
MINVLIVEDEADLATNIASYLDSLGGEFDVALTGSAEAGLAQLQVRPVDVLLTDVRLPGMDGIGLVKKVAGLGRNIKVIVMTAYGTPDTKRMALHAGAFRFLEKPLDLGELRELLQDAARSDSGWSGLVGGLDIFDITQLMAMTGKSRAIRVSFGKQKGILVFENGSLAHASTKDAEGDQAFFTMAEWAGGSFEEISGSRAKGFPSNITLPTTNLLLEAARLRDEASQQRTDDVFTFSDGAGIATQDAAQASPAGTTDADRVRALSKEEIMAIRDHLNQLQGIEGFQGAAVFASNGEMLDGFSTTGMDIKSVGMFANNALLNAQKATDQMGVGRGNMIQIRAPQATIVMRCLNEATDFAATATGKAHFHTVIVMSPEGNVGMGAMMLDKIVARIADEVR